MAPKHEKAKHDDSESENMFGGLDGTSLDKFFNPNYAVQFMAKLPKRIRERAQVLMHYHDEYEKLRKDFEEKETALRRKYDEIYLPFYERRKELVTGTGEPPKEEEIAEGFPEDHAGQVDITPTAAPAAGEEAALPKGVPGFWLRVLQHHVLSGSMIEEYDEKPLKYLVDVRSGVIDGGYGSIAVAFTFDPNPYFPEPSLVIQVVQQEKKTRIVRTAPKWNPGMDVTTKQITKKQTVKRKQPARSKTITVSQPSFFSIFQEKDDEEENDDDDDDDEAVDDEQVEQLMQVLHTSVIPNAVNCYTGEAPDGSSDIESDDEEDDEEEEEEEEEPPVPLRGRGGRRGGAPRGGRGAAGGPNAQECKQQ